MSRADGSNQKLPRFSGKKRQSHDNLFPVCVVSVGWSDRRLLTIFDRVLGLNGISTKAIILLVVIGIVYDRVEMFIDISTGYALLNVVGALAVAKYLEQKGLP